jgi:hypothetical protein
MGAEIYEVHARGPRRESVMCHLVQLGAHDGHGRMGPYQVRKARPANLVQGASWFKWDKLDLPHDGHPIVGQIYFPYGDKSIDQTQDVVVLKAVIAHYRFMLGQNEKVELEFVGHADSRGATAFNDKLAVQRAEAVRKYVDKGIRADASAHLPTMLGYKSEATSLGESDATGNHTFDRRVDIVLRSVGAKQVIREDDVFITGKVATESRVHIRRTTRKIQEEVTLDNIPQPADPGDRANRGGQVIVDSILGRTPGRSSGLVNPTLAGPDEQLESQNKVEVPRGYILAACLVLEEIESLPGGVVDVSGKSIGEKIARLPGGSVTLPGGRMIRKTRIFSYGPGRPDQPVVVTTRRTYKDEKGNVVKREDLRSSEPQPTNYNF